VIRSSRWPLRYQSGSMGADQQHVLRAPAPGRLYEWVKVASYVELGLFAGLLIVWLAPGLERPTFFFGLGHGVGFIALALLIWIAILRHEAPYTLLAATLTPVGPVGSVIAIHHIERKRRPPEPGAERIWRGGAAGGRGSTRPAPPPARR
jgi:hypothetical protein